MHVIDRATWREQPWKNGRGTTLEIVRWRIDASVWTRIDDGDYDVRVSLANVTESGPFSTFPGYRRHTFLVGPAPITLNDIELVAPGDHIELPGETAIEASLSAGPTQLLNVLVRASLAITVGHGPTAHRAMFSFELSTQIAHASETPHAIASRESIWVS